ncbi:Uroporphyrinogen III decarboxylase [Methylophaga frappieri]|uniref:Uroporphyrinogen decarboxylase n=1 Tax=Methylophaga frappieri (strain ATCC BAA-2434 / DSM 25690 / JAM7) TaxID=754477 RepID=I1YJH8_METFJ|nr:uroporphyrinogen decarboxylase [Methylophaga frappieri]AFJ03071.1 Uroporphyrinogen III decarboxylase [Methylophaga frappieri]
MSQLENDRYLRALRRQPVDRTPIWIMRQAGRYLPEYREVRKQAGDFMTLCRTPELACEVTLQPLRRFDLDASIIFSDILTIPDAMGLGLYFVTGEGPKFERTIGSAADVAQLPIPDMHDTLGYVMDAIRLTRREINNKVPLIGFSGSPWTLACYMVEGGASKDFAKVKAMAFDAPELMYALLAKLATAVTDYLNAQIDAGAQALMLFDTWGGALSGEAYRAFSLRYMQQIIDGVKQRPANADVPITLFTKGGGQWLSHMADTGADALGLDWTTDIALARQLVGDRVALQGNMDPCLLYASPKRIEQEVQQILSGFGHGNGHVFNLGHGIHPTIDPEHVSALVEAVHQYSALYHQN